MSIDIILYVEEGLGDDDLTFDGNFLPDSFTTLLPSIQQCNKIYSSIHTSYQGKLKKTDAALPRETIDDNQFWKDALSRTGADHLVKIFADSPFLDLSIINDMIQLHIDYMAEYTYSENLPSGLGCEIVSKDLIDALPETDKKTLSLSKVVKSNINQFDIEIYYRDPDIRDKRIAFRSGKKRDRAIMENLLSIHGELPQYSSINTLITDNPESLYIGPSYLEIELTGRCQLECIFCYRDTLKQEHGDIEIDHVRKILDDMKGFQLPYTICFGGSGEPLLHEQFYEIAEMVLNEPEIEQLIVETNGMLADSNYAHFVQNSGKGKIKTIININGFDNDTYQSIHGNDTFQHVHDNIEELKKSIENDDLVYIQVMKINETEPFLDRYYDFWEEKKVPIILQKQNIFCSRVKDRRYSDLSPVVRIPCWHLQRDLYLLADGSAGFCKQDVDAEYFKESVIEKSLQEIWKIKNNAYLNDYKGTYPKKPDCTKCDEWYTFNF